MDRAMEGRTTRLKLRKRSFAKDLVQASRFGWQEWRLTFEYFVGWLASSCRPSALTWTYAFKCQSTWLQWKSISDVDVSSTNMWLAKRARVFQTVKVGFGKKNDALYLGGGWIHLGRISIPQSRRVDPFCKTGWTSIYGAHHLVTTYFVQAPSWWWTKISATMPLYKGIIPILGWTDLSWEYFLKELEPRGAASEDPND